MRFWQRSKSQKVISKTHNTVSTRCSHSVEQTEKIFSQSISESRIYDFTKIAESDDMQEKEGVVKRDFFRVISPSLEKL